MHQNLLDWLLICTPPASILQVSTQRRLPVISRISDVGITPTEILTNVDVERLLNYTSSTSVYGTCIKGLVLVRSPGAGATWLPAKRSWEYAVLDSVV